MIEADYESACLLMAEDESTPLTTGSDLFAECTSVLDEAASAEDAQTELEAAARDRTATERDNHEATVELEESEASFDLVQINGSWYIVDTN